LPIIESIHDLNRKTCDRTAERSLKLRNRSFDAAIVEDNFVMPASRSPDGN
jgi:hypothetical protein